MIKAQDLFFTEDIIEEGEDINEETLWLRVRAVHKSTLRAKSRWIQAECADAKALIIECFKTHWIFGCESEIENAFDCKQAKEVPEKKQTFCRVGG
jgi:hypothetical protein